MLTVLVAGFFVGLVYGLLAIGIVLIYRGTRVLNFALGETGMIAALVFNELWLQDDLPLLVALGAALLIAAAIGVLIEMLLVRPLRNADRLRPTVGTFAVAALLVAYAGRRWGLYPQRSQPLAADLGIALGDVNIRTGQLLILGLATVVVAGVFCIYRYTAFGLKLKASALDPYAATLIGVNINRTSALVWAGASALAGACAILIGSIGAPDVSFMTLFALRATAAALVGGLTSIGGALGAGIMLGIVEAVIAFEAPVTGINEIILAGFVLTLLVLRPRGLVKSAY